MEAKLKAAQEAYLFALPEKESFPLAPPDLVASLQRRDLKLTTAMDSRMVAELGELMLPTFIFPLNMSTARALCDSYLSPSIEECKEEYQEELKALEKKINDEIEQLAPDCDKFFIKLSFMSPKDVVIRVSNQVTLNNVYKQLDKLFNNLKNPTKVNFQSCAITRAWLNALYQSIGCRNGKEAVEMLLQSYRTNEELKDSLLVDEYYGNTNIVLRSWVHIRPGFEFRVYVSNKEVTAISQYESVYYPELYSEKNIVFPGVLKFVQENIIPIFESRLPSFVVDVVLTEEGKYFVCELNPFASSSSGCLFSWQDDKQKFMIGPLECRCVPPPSFKNCRTAISKNGNHLRYEIVDGSNQETVPKKLILDDANDSFGLKLSDEWQHEISQYWKSKIPNSSFYNPTLYVVLGLMICIAAFFILLANK